MRSLVPAYLISLAVLSVSRCGEDPMTPPIDGAPNCIAYSAYLHASGAVRTPGDAQAVVLSGSHAYVADGPSGLQVIDISNPGAPAVIGSVDTPGDARGVAVAGSYAYVADGAAGLQLVDISDPAHPALVGGGVAPGDDAQTVVVAGSYAYVAGTAGLKIIDISNPASPAIVGAYPPQIVATGVAVAGSMPTSHTRS